MPEAGTGGSEQPVPVTYQSAGRGSVYCAAYIAVFDDAIVGITI